MKKAKDYINLLPPEEKQSRPLSRSVLAIGLFALALVVMFGWQAIYVLELHSRSAALMAKKKALQDEIALVYKELGIVLPAGTTPEKAWLIQNILSERVLWSEVFRQFAAIVPRGLWFDSLEGSSAGNAEIKIRGGTFHYNTIAAFMLAMERSPYFSKPQLRFAQKAVVQGRDTVAFEILCGIKKRREQ